MTKSHILSVALVFLVLSAVSTVTAGTVSYQYDGLHRLIHMEQLDGTEIDYSYGDVGNRISKVVTEADDDLDGLPNRIENNYCTSSLDADTDNDGISDGDEDTNHNGVVDTGETDPCNIDTDGDGIQDGTESGVTNPVADPDGAGPLEGTDTAIFQPDLDPSTTTNPLLASSDGDGLTDGQEDLNANGRFDPGEYDPLVHAPYIKRIIPVAAQTGTEITITGTHFHNNQGSGYVTFFDQIDASDITLWSNTEIKCLVPAGSQIGCLTVTTIGGPSYCKFFGKERYGFMPPILELLNEENN